MQGMDSESQTFSICERQLRVKITLRPFEHMAPWFVTDNDNSPFRRAGRCITLAMSDHARMLSHGNQARHSEQNPHKERKNDCQTL